MISGFCLVRSITFGPSFARPLVLSAASKASATFDDSKDRLNLSSNNEDSKSSNNDNKATIDQLLKLEARIQEYGPKFIVRPLDLSFYTQDLLFINNIRGQKTVNLVQYATYLGLVKAYYIVNYTSSRVELLNLVKNPEESYLRIRWRFVSRPGWVYMAFFFWRMHSKEFWSDGISTLHVNRDGKVYRHVCDNIDMDIHEIGPKQKGGIKNPLMNRGVNV